MAFFASSVMTALIDQPVRYDLAESTCPPLRLGDLGDPRTLAEVELGYGTSLGEGELRSLIAADIGVDPAAVLVTVGAIEAMFLLAQATCGPGDEAVLTTPCFPPVRAVPEALGARVVAVPLAFDEGYRMPLDRMAEALSPSTRLVSLASPQNPSGIRFAEPELKALIDLVAERAPRAKVLIDETYRASTFGDAPIPSSAATSGPQVVTCSSLSKAHGAAGLRVGWLTATDAELFEQLRQAKFHTTIACSTVDERLAAQVLRQQDRILAPRALRLGQALGALERWAEDQPLELLRPDGGALCVVRLAAEHFPDGDAVAAFYRRLARHEVRVAPGSWFGEDDRVFRLGFGHLPAADFTEALDRLAAALAIVP
ncbi:pyridoxal phosphate-dependent aminotransferase [Actinospica robiniae]|uniref:pyridoxal phosphate-dependent aminotransferase n=1 Tax=Actinospica robiniae TaxID=304901 RepID=UPI00041786B7|nr:pyridoxal phosphate-dependent aminotransferase [Actinospica robiniae]